MKMKKRMRKMLSMFLALLMMCSVIGTDITLFLPTINAEAATVDYGLLDNACDGLILHCWNWSYTNIKDSMADIAAAGYTSLQTSPVQMAKDAGSTDTQYAWWKVYQPTTLSMVDNHPWFGTKAEFKAMCDEADKYGIKIIVDIVSNHMANNTGQLGNTKADICSQNDPTFRDDDSCWHLNGSTGIDYSNQHRNGDTSSLTHGFGGWPDLNTGNPKVQNAIISLLKECVDLGADGFRFDAAKHIELPTDPGGASDFWPNVTSAIREYKPDVYLYGEILDDSATSISNYTKYLAVTDNRAGNATSWGVNNRDVGAAANSTLTYSGEKGDNIVLWAESHDTYAGNNFTDSSSKLSQDVINKAWCIHAARDFAALYYIRPGDKNSKMGSKSTNTAWKDSEIVAVNKFHNYFNGKSEYMSSCDNSVVLVERGSKTDAGGVVLVNIGGGSKTVSGATTHLLADGTYTDQVSNTQFTVSGGKISGNIGNTGVAVVYNAKPVVKDPAPTISQEGGSFSSDTLVLTIGLNSSATSGTYKIGNGTAQTYTGSKTITIGADMAYGDSVTVTLTATDGTNTTTETYTFTKQEQVQNIAYLKLPSGWGSKVSCYAYDSATEAIENAIWPGEPMTLDAETGYYKYVIPENIEKPRVIFYNSDENRTPAAMAKGHLFETDGSYLYADGIWSKYTQPVTTKGTVIVKYVDEAGAEIADSQTLTGTVGESYGATAAVIDGYTLKTTPSNATGKYTSSTITVTYVYRKQVVIEPTEPSITSSLATGSTFSTETATIKLTLANAVSGTYSVDDGPEKTFTGSTDVVLGQGKIADSTVTVKATARASDGTSKTFTFTYNKKFNGTVNEETSVAKTAASSSKLDSQYATNPNGAGIKKTIKVDGDISDWNSSMIVAQGAANDDPRVYRPNSMYEIPFDLYALYACYDDDNLYLMWEMTDVQDVVAPDDVYPLTQGILYQTQNVPFFIAIDTRDSESAIGNNCQTADGGTLWGRGVTFGNNVNKIVAISTNGANGPYIYGGDSTGLNAVEEYSPATAGVTFKWGLGILSSKVMGIDGGYGEYNGRVLGDMTTGATYVDFNTKGHDSSTLDFHYEMSIPLSKLGTTADKVASDGLGVMLAILTGSAMDCLPYDMAMNDNADLPDTESQANNSFEKSDADHITAAFASIGAAGTVIPDDPDELELNFGADRSSPQSSGTALTLNGIAKGGTAPYTYKYYVNNSLVATKTGSGATSTPWTPAAAGTYMIKCVATDAEGNSVTSAKKYIVEGASAATGKVIVKYVDESGAEIAASQTLTGTVGISYTTEAAGIAGYTLKTTPANATGTYTEADITVTYVYKKNSTPPTPEKTGTVTVKYVDESGAEIKESETKTGKVGESYTTTAAVIEGYTVKTTPANATGTYTEEDITVTYIYKENSTPPTPVKTGKVIVKYVDESGKEIKTSDTKTGKVGVAYTTTAAVIEGYTVKTPPANAAGTYTEADITVTYIYKKNAAPQTAYTVYLELPEGWEEPVKCLVYSGSGSDSVLELEMTKDPATGYYVCEIPDTITNPKVIFRSGNKTCPADGTRLDLTTEGSWVYKDGQWGNYTGPLPPVTKKGKVIIRYVDESGTKLRDPQAMFGTVGATYKTEAINITGYTIKTTPVNYTGTYTEEEITVTYVYKKNSTPTPVATGTVTVKYVDESGKAVAAQKTLKGNVGAAYTTTAATVAGYTLKTTPANAKGTYTKANITVTYVYKKNSTTSTKVKVDKTFRKMLARVIKTTKTSNKLKWSKVKGADGYIVYGATAKKKLKKLKTLKGTTYTHKKLKKGTYYKYEVKAYKVINGKKVVIATSKTAYSTTDGGKYGNAKKIKVNKTSVKLKKGGKFTIKASAVKKNRKIKTYRKLTYESSNTKVATVSKKGVIKAKKKGTCTIYVYTQNGVYKKIKVTVK